MRTIGTSFAILLAFGILSAGAQDEAPVINQFEFDAVPGWNNLTFHGNESFLFQYGTIPDDFFGDMVAGTFRTFDTKELLFTGMLRDIGERSQAGYGKLAFGGSESYIRFWSERFQYYSDPTLGEVIGAEQNYRKAKGHFSLGERLPTVDLTASDRTVFEPDIVRLRPGPPQDFRNFQYSGEANYAVFGGKFQFGLGNSRFEDNTGYQPSGNSHNVSFGTTQSIGDRFSASLNMANVYTDQDGLGGSTLRSWAGSATWLVLPKVVWRASGQINRIHIPFTVSRFASHRDVFNTDVNWRPIREFGLQAGYTRRNLERIKEGSQVTQRPAINETFVTARYRPGALGDLMARYRTTRIIDAPEADISAFANTATLYYDQVDRFDARWSKMFWYTTDLHAGYQWSKRRHTERDSELRLQSFNAGVSSELSPNLSFLIDFLWEDWSGNGPDFDSTGLNTGDDGSVTSGAENRLLFSQGQSVTFGLNYLLNNRTWIDGTAVVYTGHGGERARNTFAAIDLRQEFLNGLIFGIGFQRQVFTDDFVGGNDYDSNVFRITLTAKFSVREAGKGEGENHGGK